MFSSDSQLPNDSKFIRDRQLAHPSQKIESDISSSKAAVETPDSQIDRQSWEVAPNLLSSFKYAWAGIAYAFETQRNFRIHTCVGLFAIFLCWALKVSTLEIAVICLTIGAVLVMEILNTALESLVDLTVGQTYHELAKIAKDCAAGAVLMAAIVALLIAALIFVPPLWDICGIS
ncbi:MAG: diacylglycerol kinase family protein [Phormidesmis sp. RL_2_1]|nr:diacylglycerol kinase family protein [Phormidesmis sp. RL_2_1]